MNLIPTVRMLWADGQATNDAVFFCFEHLDTNVLGEGGEAKRRHRDIVPALALGLRPPGQ